VFINTAKSAIVSIDLFDSYGHLVYEHPQKFYSPDTFQSFQISTSELLSGTYFLKSSFEDEVFVKKIIINHTK
jgi:hypothetical protein